MSETTGERIRRVRLAKGRTHREVAAAAGIGYPYLSRLEAGRNLPSDDVIERLAAVLDDDVDELIITTGRVPRWAADALIDDPPAALDALRAFVDRPR